MLILRNWAVAIAAAFAMWSVAPSSTLAAMPGNGVGSAVQNAATKGDITSHVRRCRYCNRGGGRGFSRGGKRNFSRGPRARGYSRGGGPRYRPRSRGRAAAPARRGGRDIRRGQSRRAVDRGQRRRTASRGRGGSRDVRARRGSRKNANRDYRRRGGKGYRNGRKRYAHGKGRGRGYRDYGHYKKHCRRRCGRYKHRRKHYVHYYGGYWYSWPWWSISLAVPVYAYSYDRYHEDDLHTAYCLGRYKSYDPYSDTYVAYSGTVRRCRSPYSG